MATTPNLTTTPARPSATTATIAATKSLSRPQSIHSSAYSIYHHHQSQSHHLYPSQNPSMRPQTQTPNPNSTPQQGIRYPVESSGRGFISRTTLRPQDQTVTVANSPNLVPGAYHPRVPSYRPLMGTGSGSSPRSHLQLDSGVIHHSPAHMVRQHPAYFHHHHQQHYVNATGGLSVASPPIKGIPVAGHPKTGPAPSPVSNSNGHKTLRDRGRDDAVITVRDRKVRILDGESLYALCRSWLRNGFPGENQTHYGDGVKSLPRPLPIPVVDTHSPKKKDAEGDEEEEESVDHLSMQDLLKKHIKRAKRVRSRLREERQKRIARYKTRLALLLPQQVEQLRNDSTAGN